MTEIVIEVSPAPRASKSPPRSTSPTVCSGPRRRSPRRDPTAHPDLPPTPPPSPTDTSAPKKSGSNSCAAIRPTGAWCVRRHRLVLRRRTRHHRRLQTRRPLPRHHHRHHLHTRDRSVPLLPVAAPLRHHVGNVVGLRTYDQMGWVTARRIVTRVHHHPSTAGSMPSRSSTTTRVAFRTRRLSRPPTSKYPYPRML